MSEVIEKNPDPTTEACCSTSGGCSCGQKLSVLLLVVILAVVGFMAYKQTLSSTAISKFTVDSSKYQAVFLTNGQVYFGKVSKDQAGVIDLSEVYYMNLKQPLQSQEKNEAEEQPGKPEYSLIKLGKEVHGPTSMTINREHILFIENLADDSKVVSTIKGGK